MKKLLFVLVLTSAIFSLFAAPKLKVTSFKLDPKDMKNAFGKNAVYDRNKDLCATLRIESALRERSLSPAQVSLMAHPTEAWRELLIFL